MDQTSKTATSTQGDRKIVRIWTHKGRMIMERSDGVSIIGDHADDFISASASAEISRWLALIETELMP
jgi:hypothetical protein